MKTQLRFTSTWPTRVDHCPNRANSMCPTSTSDLRAAHVSLNIARGRGKLHKVKPAAVFIIFLHDLWPTGNGRTVVLENSRALICFDCYDKRKKRFFFLFWVFKKCLSIDMKKGVIIRLFTMSGYYINFHYKKTLCVFASANKALWPLWTHINVSFWNPFSTDAAKWIPTFQVVSHWNYSGDIEENLVLKPIFP